MEIFRNVLAHNYSQHLKQQELQKFLLKSAYPIVKILDSILTRSVKRDQTLINKIQEVASM